MAEQTAMQELIKWGDEMLQNNPNKILSFSEVIDKAQEFLPKEKQQIKKSFNHGNFSAYNCNSHQSAEQYYNQTYNK
ncbi:hypothetical protein UFOVP321_27 [uncultured Caudovirales phage]|uniref:Uncharacterized protein n=1 Tax=uncultured Caudovirales phage TaxID=2100421 RepID=A0A6J5LTA1_9CAUD|nr:hypothetical protein UFOVP321_27 [uncultured Caudovirales phage]